MEKLTLPPRLMLVSDLDHTMVDHHDPQNLSLLRFIALWECRYRHNSVLVFSTERSPTRYKQLRNEKPILTADITIMSMGTEIAYGTSLVPDDSWVEVLNRNWNRNVVREETSKFPELTLQPETEQRPHKVSFHVDKDKAENVTKELSNCLEKRGLDVKIIYSGGIDLDILPREAGKGQALAFLLEKFKGERRQPVNTLVCGDSGSDAELFSIPEVYGVMVSNAQEELLQWHAVNNRSNPRVVHATERCASGIIEAIGHFKLGPNISPRDVSNLSQFTKHPFSPAHAVVMFYLFYERWRRAEIEDSELYIKCFKDWSHPTGVFHHPSGVLSSLRDGLDKLKVHYGGMKRTDFRTWVDLVITIETSPGNWLVTYDKWLSLSGTREGCTCSAKFSSTGGINTEEGFTGANIEGSRSNESTAKANTVWLMFQMERLMQTKD